MKIIAEQKVQMLTEQQIKILEAVVRTIIPADDYPDGWDAGVGTYLLHQFEHDLKNCVDVYQIGLLAIDREAQAMSEKNFAELTPEAREMLLATIEHGTVRTSWQSDPTAFIQMITGHCAEGFYSDPGNGGNKDGIAWQMIGFEVTA